ncbi:hypothetical protein NDU88_000372, partial [Pleurodeles waltl]
ENEGCDTPVTRGPVVWKEPLANICRTASSLVTSGILCGVCRLAVICGSIWHSSCCMASQFCLYLQMMSCSLRPWRVVLFLKTLSCLLRCLWGPQWGGGGCCCW